MSEILHKQNDHGMCEVYLNNGVKCDMNQSGIEYIIELEGKLIFAIHSLTRIANDNSPPWDSLDHKSIASETLKSLKELK